MRICYCESVSFSVKWQMINDMKKKQRAIRRSTTTNKVWFFTHRFWWWWWLFRSPTWASTWTLRSRTRKITSSAEFLWFLCKWPLNVINAHLDTRKSVKFKTFEKQIKFGENFNKNKLPNVANLKYNLNN